MNKTKSLVKYLKYINNLINSLLEKNLNRLKFNNLLNLARSNKIILTFVAFFIFFITYLLIPTFYKQSDIIKQLNSNLLEKFNLDVKFSGKFNYNIFPSPHFKITDSSIILGEDEISNIKKMNIYISLKKFFSKDKIDIKDVIIEDANFNLNSDNYKFFFDLLENDFKNTSLKIQNSNIFFRSNENEVLVINKVHNIKYYYDNNELKNILLSNNEIFNIPYKIKILNDQTKKVIFTELDLNFLKLKLENEHSYSVETYNGMANLNIKNLKSLIKYQGRQSYFEFKFFDKVDNPKFEYVGKFNFKPFYSTFEGYTKKLNLSYLLDTNSLIFQLVKTELFNNKNIDFKLNIDSDYINNNSNFKNIKLNSKFKDGLIDVDETSFNWKDIIFFNLSNSLIFVKEGELILDSKLSTNILDNNKIYKFLLTPKKFRKKIKRIDFNFTYNFDQKTANLKDIRVNGKLNQNVNKIFSNLMLKKENLKNRIYLKNLLNQAIKNYEG